MSILDPLIRYGNAVAMENEALQSTRAISDEAKAISRLARKAVALAEEHGETLTHRQAIQRARENLAYVRRREAQP